MDGVIFDSEVEHLRFGNELFKKLGIEVSLEEHNTFVGTTSHYMWEVIKNRHGLSQSVEDLVKMDREGYFEFLVSGKHSMTIVKGVKELIEELYKNNVKLAVASSSPIDVIETVVDMYDIRKYFDYLVTGDYVKRSKPNPDVFLYAAEKLNTAPKDCIVIEDSTNGVLAAKKAGMKCIGFNNPNSGKQDLSPADMIIDSYSKINYEKMMKLL